MAPTKNEHVCTLSNCGCNHGSCGCAELHKHFLLRVIVGIIILVTVFWLGMKIGEVKSYIRSDQYMGHFDSRNMMRFETRTAPIVIPVTASGTPVTQN